MSMNAIIIGVAIIVSIAGRSSEPESKRQPRAEVPFRVQLGLVRSGAQNGIICIKNLIRK